MKAIAGAGAFLIPLEEAGKNLGLPAIAFVRGIAKSTRSSKQFLPDSGKAAGTA